MTNRRQAETSAHFPAPVRSPKYCQYMGFADVLTMNR